MEKVICFCGEEVECTHWEIEHFPVTICPDCESEISLEELHAEAFPEETVQSQGSIFARGEMSWTSEIRKEGDMPYPFMGGICWTSEIRKEGDMAIVTGARLAIHTDPVSHLEVVAGLIY